MLHSGTATGSASLWRCEGMQSSRCKGLRISVPSNQPLSPAQPHLLPLPFSSFAGLPQRFLFSLIGEPRGRWGASIGEGPSEGVATRRLRGLAGAEILADEAESKQRKEKLSQASVSALLQLSPLRSSTVQKSAAPNLSMNSFLASLSFLFRFQ